MFVILKMGDTMRECAKIYGDFEDWTLKAMDIAPNEATVINPKKQKLPELQNIKGIIITGSHDMVTNRADWMENSSAWLKDAASKNIPILGVCFGHQLIAQTFGGVVGNHPEGPEIGTVDINLNENAKNDALFSYLPQTFLAHATHTQSVLQLPKNATLLAYNCYEPCHAFRIGKNIWGVQFHPEQNADIMKEYILAQRDKLQNTVIVLNEVRETPYANNLIKKFVKLCENAPKVV
jgi:GMP synthase (glutamine-hydrolysing)